MQLNHDEEFSQIGSAAFSHHIVSLTSTTYGLLSLDPPQPADCHSPSAAATVPPTPTQPPPPPRCTLGSLFPSPLSEPRSLRYQPLETINSWDLMSGLESDRIPSFRFSPAPFLPSKISNSSLPKQSLFWKLKEENINPNISHPERESSNSKDSTCVGDLLHRFEMICPPNGENKAVMYSTTLRGVRTTFENCNAVRSAIEVLGILICERDVSMDRGFRDELRELMKGKESSEMIPPRIFVKGRYIGGFENVMKMLEEGTLGELFKGLPKVRVGHVCEGCGGVRFLPCFKCNGSCKTVITASERMEMEGEQAKGTVVVRCSDCNENGLVLCPICT
ncbi:hypothetical protein F511_19561 [Dorcoceras hygrometricum]|uniref:Glutaredoxin domain-containing protein n=1 Tax=Dorcoceras hygrometricum TaxID=472368 RepID=A0A2Z7ALV7_9LAMI|nr:hypothetical protein F511_19561 [Dorcoceras hygrometricum]